jgi:Protein kinase domain
MTDDVLKELRRQEELDAIDEKVLTALADSAELSVGELTGLLRVPHGRIEVSISSLLERGHIARVARGGMSPAYRAVSTGAGAQELRIDVAVTRGPDRDGDVTVEGRATNTTVADRLEAIQITIDAVTVQGEPNGFRTVYPSPGALDPGDSASFSTYVRLKDPSAHGSVGARLLNARRIPRQAPASVTPKATAYRTFRDIYTVVRQHGQGGCGVVFEVRSSSDERLALKLLDPRTASADRVKRFRQEVGWCEQERHRNVLRVIDRGISEPDGHPFYLMKFYPTTLRTAIKTRLGPVQALELFLQVLDGLSTAHAAGVIHRDIKPENILYDPAEALVVVADFGIAHFAEEELLTAVETGSGERLANFGYAAPEQRVRNGAIDRRTDLFALGSVLNELFTGHAVHGIGYPAISSAAPEYGYLDPIVAKMVQYDPAARPSSIQEVRDAICAAATLPGPRPAEPPTK